MLLEGANADALQHRGLGDMSPLLRYVERRDDDVVRAMLARGRADATASVGTGAVRGNNACAPAPPATSPTASA